MHRLAGQGDAAVAFIEHRLLGRRTVPREAAAEWINCLDADDPGERLLAQHWLECSGDSALDLLERAATHAASPEARRRAAAARAWLVEMRSDRRQRRDLRAIVILEWIETPAAVALLRKIATRGDLAAPATEALRRLEEPRG